MSTRSLLVAGLQHFLHYGDLLLQLGRDVFFFGRMRQFRSRGATQCAAVQMRTRVLWQSGLDEPSSVRHACLAHPSPLLQVEGSLSRCSFRIAGIAVGSLLAFATGLSGSALNNPFYITSMVGLLVGIFSLAYPVAEFRWVLSWDRCMRGTGQGECWCMRCPTECHFAFLHDAVQVCCWDGSVHDSERARHVLRWMLRGAHKLEQFCRQGTPEH